MKCLAMVVVVMLLLLVSVAWGQPGYTVLGTHAHSGNKLGFTDGTLGFDQLLEKFRSAGCQFVAIADHAEMINTPPDQRAPYQKLYQITKWFGIDNWIAQVVSHPDLVPGVECGLGAGRKSHLLFYGGRLEDYRKIVSIIEAKGESDPRGTVEYLRGRADASAGKANAILIVAHPFCALYPFTEPIYDLADGVEVFDGISSDPVKEIKLIAMMSRAYERPLTVMTGSDYHGVGVSRASEAFGDAVQDIYEPCLERRTLVKASSRDDIPGALKRAECYAAFRKSRIASATTWPGGTHDPTNVFKIACSGLDKTLGNEAFVLLVGRSGQSMAADAPLAWKGNAASLSLDLRAAPPDVIKSGAFLYLVVARQLATSGIEVLPYDAARVAKRPEPEPEPTPGPDRGGLDLGGLDLGDFGGVFGGKLGGAAKALLEGLGTGSRPSTVGKALLAILEWALVDRGVITPGGPAAGGTGGSRSAQGQQGGLGIPTTGGGGGSLSAQGPQEGLKIPR